MSEKSCDNCRSIKCDTDEFPCKYCSMLNKHEFALPSAESLEIARLGEENETITEEKELWRKLAGQRGLDNEELKEEMVETKDGLTAVYMSGYNDCEAKMRVEANTLKAERDNYKEGLEVIVKQEEALSSVDYIEPAVIARAHLKVLK